MKRGVKMLRKVISVILIVTINILCLSMPLQSKAETSSVPTTLKGVTYKFNDNVKFLNIADMVRFGDNVKIPGVSLSAGDVVVDKRNQTSLKVLKVNSDGTLVTIKPTMLDLFKEFNIPRQVIEPTAANITEYAVKGISVEEYTSKLKGQQSDGSSGQKLMSGNLPDLMDEIKAKFQARGTKIYEYSGEYEFSPFAFKSQDTVKLSLDGALGVSPGVVAEYSLFDGYEFGFVDAAQFIELNMMFDVKINEEMYLPVFAVTIPIEGLGGIKLGVYLVVDVKGDITLTVKAEEGIIANASVYGGTSFGVPTSFHVNSGLEKYYGAECDPMGVIKAGLYITPLVNLEILDVDVFGAQVRLGFYGYAEVSEETMNYGVDFVVHAFVVILDERTDLINVHVPIIERNKTFRAQDDVIFYFSRLCVYQDRINVAAMTKRLSGSTSPNAKPFSDKLPFANRSLEIWYYRSGNDPQGGNNPNPNYKIPVKTDDNGCIGVDFKALKGPGYENGVDVKKDDIIKITAPGFIGQTDLIKSVSPFGIGKQPGQSDFYGSSKLPGDFFEDKVYFNTLSGWDLTGLDVPNVEGVEFIPKKRIHYNGTVKLYSTDKTTNTTETAWFKASENTTEYTPLKSGLVISAGPYANATYNVKPNNEMRWQINLDGYIYGTYEPTGAGGPETTHNVSIKRVVEDKQAAIEDYKGNTIGIQHNVALRLIAVNKSGTKPFKGNAKLYYALGKVPPDYIQSVEKDLAIVDLGYIKFPAANVRYPNHYEYYVTPPFPAILYEKKDAPDLIINQVNNISSTISTTDAGAVSQAHYLWRWEELKPNIPERISVDKIITTRDATGAPITITESIERLNRVYKVPEGTDISEFNGIPVTYTVYDPSAGRSIMPEELQDESTTAGGWNVYQMRHIVSGITLEGVELENPSFIPPAPTVKGDLSSLTPGDARAFDIEFQLHMMKEHSDRFVVSPLEQGILEQYREIPAVMKNISSIPAKTIKNLSSLPNWSKGYINAVVNNNIMSLDAQGNFPTGKFTTRAEFSAAIVNALGLTSADAVKTGFPFKDVSSKDKNLEGMMTAYQCGIISGTSSTTFNPAALVTRQDASTMLMRAFNLRNSSLIPANTQGSLNVFSDGSTISKYAVPSLEQAVSLKLFGGYGDGSFKPKNNIKNEETAKIVWELKLKAEKPGLQWEQ